MDIKLKTRKEMEKDIPRDKLGWWYDVCPGKVIKNVRQATQEDLDRCCVRKDAKPDDYFCEEFIEDGSLINKLAVSNLIFKVTDLEKIQAANQYINQVAKLIDKKRET